LFEITEIPGLAESLFFTLIPSSVNPFAAIKITFPLPPASLQALALGCQQYMQVTESQEHQFL